MGRIIRSVFLNTPDIKGISRSYELFVFRYPRPCGRRKD
jgi:hypothetical protein